MNLADLTNEQLVARLEQAKVDAEGIPFCYDCIHRLREAEQNNADLQRQLRDEIARREVAHG